MISVARHKLIDHYRRAESEQRKLASVWADSHGDGTEDLLEMSNGEPGTILELLRRLSPRHRLVLVLRYLEDLPISEIARSVDRTVKATESLLVRARRELNRAYAEMER